MEVFLGTGVVTACLKELGNRLSDRHLLKSEVKNGQSDSIDSLNSQVGMGSRDEVLLDARHTNFVVSAGRSVVKSLSRQSSRQGARTGSPADSEYHQPCV